MPVASLSVDSWGVDYVLLNAVHPILWPPFHYRDARTEETYEKVRASVGSELIFAETGIQFMPINTIYHLASDVEKSRNLLEVADCFLTIGDYFNYLFSGVARVDESNASTTQLYNPRTRSWSDALIERCGFPRKIFPQLVAPGTVLGPLLPEVAAETNLNECRWSPPVRTILGPLWPPCRRRRNRIGPIFPRGPGHCSAWSCRGRSSVKRFANTISPTKPATVERHAS